MALTLVDIIERLKQLDEVTIMEVLDLSTEYLVERFADVIEDKFDQLEADFSDDDSRGKE
jgi:hypothetical protein